MANRRAGGPKIKEDGAKSIFFERMLDGSWTASTETADGKILGFGATVLDARVSLDKLLRKLLNAS